MTQHSGLYRPVLLQVIGIPNEAYGNGFLANRWPCMSLCVVAGSVTLSSRLREVAVERKYNSPASLVQDRYQSKALHRCISLIMAIPMQFYVMAQFAALGSTVLSLSQGAGRNTRIIIIIIIITIIIIIIIIII
jgi:Na+/proline symporter